MPTGADILVVGGGVAGLSAGAFLAPHAQVVVIEAEDHLGTHSSGRSATMLHYALGDELVRALTLASRSLFDDPPEDFTDVPLGTPAPVLVHATESEQQSLALLHSAIAPFARLEPVGPDEMARLCPILKIGPGAAVAGLLDPRGIRLDPNALLHAYARALRVHGGTVVTGARLSTISRTANHWHVKTEQGADFSAPLVINAAGAWADQVAALAGIAPLGLEPLRRTIITFDGPPGADVANWPFTKTVGDELYFAPESGRLLASPMDEVPDEPCDAQPGELEVALAAWRMEERTTLKVQRIYSRWAGLRTFSPDRRPVVGLDPRAEGFFWLAGQGGFGLQTSPAVARIVESLVAGSPWPVPALAAADLAPDRFFG